MAWGQVSGMPFRCDDSLFRGVALVETVLERLESTLGDEVLSPVGGLSLLLMDGSVSGEVWMLGADTVECASHRRGAWQNDDERAPRLRLLDAERASAIPDVEPDHSLVPFPSSALFPGSENS